MSTASVRLVQSSRQHSPVWTARRRERQIAAVTIPPGFLRGAFAGMLIALTSCATEPERIPFCTWGMMTIQTDLASGTPIFLWDPPCEISGLDVGSHDDLGQYVPAWTVRTDANAIRPGVKYGVTPRGATVVHPPITLTPGKSYFITIFWGPNNYANYYTSGFIAPPPAITPIANPR